MAHTDGIESFSAKLKRGYHFDAVVKLNPAVGEPFAEGHSQCDLLLSDQIRDAGVKKDLLSEPTESVQ